MKLLNKTMNSMKNMKTLEIVLFVLLVLYLVSGVSTPYELSPYVNNIFMYASIFALAYIIYLCGNTALAIFFAFVGLVFINRSRKVDLNVMKPTQQNKNADLNKLNSHLKETTLEEEMVGQIERNPDNSPGPSNYHPVLCESHNASQI